VEPDSQKSVSEGAPSATKGQGRGSGKNGCHGQQSMPERGTPSHQCVKSTGKDSIYHADIPSYLPRKKRRGAGGKGLFSGKRIPVKETFGKLYRE